MSVISDDDASSASGSSDKSRGAFSNLFRFIFVRIVKPLQALGQFLGPKRSNFASSSSLSVGTGASVDDELDQGGVTHHSHTQVLKNFYEIQCLRIELPNGELGIDEGVLFKRA
ncbi:F-box protein [Camellia lanceoleosa]|uniref:F-box protein n=1 Tax=Camellia lanceoleosa TaxID=1840588 RepID=A0ACC0GC82_9ERIC|nr:F-box protein [Camellia lanceoleosa]